jgi:hypothetical protein
MAAEADLEYYNKDEHQFLKSETPAANGSCPPGYTKRKAYMIDKTGKIVPARCIVSLASSAPRSRKNCPPGKIYRSSYIRKYSNRVKAEGYLVKRGDKIVRIFPQENAIRVGSACVDADEVEALDLPNISKMQQGLLLRYGYNFRFSQRFRQQALIQAARAYGAKAVYDRLADAAERFKTLKPEASKVFSADRDWTKRTFKIGA